MKFLKKNNNKLLIFIFTLILFVTVVSVSYSYYKVNNSNEKINNVTTDIECLDVQYSAEGLHIFGADAVPVYDEVALNDDAYKTTAVVTNRCNTRKAYTLAYVDYTGSFQYADRYKYAVHEIGSDKPTKGNNFPVASTTADSQVYALYKYYNVDNNISTISQDALIYPIKTMILKPNETKTFDVYTWIDYYEGDVTESGLNDGDTADTSFAVNLALIKGNVIDTSGTLANSLIDSAIPLSEAATGEDALVDFGEYGVRYVGNNPNNFVEFNDELWRIVGIFNDDSHGVTGEKLVKIVRARPVDSIVYWDNNYHDNSDQTHAYWSRSQLMLILNSSEYNTYYTINSNTAYENGRYIQGNVGSYYYNTEHCEPSKTSCSHGLSLGGLRDDQVRNMIQEVEIPMYFSNNSEVYKNLYYSERSSAAPGSGIQYDDPWRGKVLLLHATDAAFASSGGGSTEISTCMEKKAPNMCLNNNWILNSNVSSITLSGVWTMNSWYVSSVNNRLSYVTSLSTSGSYSVYPYVYLLSGLVRPVVYLKPNVVIKGGSGTANYPYLLEQFNEQ